MKRLCMIVLALCLFAAGALAHSGRTDSKGGHYNRSTGEYHYHHGYSAHDHPGGVCPYEKKATAKPKGTTGGWTVIQRTTPKPTAKPTPRPTVRIPTKSNVKSSVHDTGLSADTNARSAIAQMAKDDQVMLLGIVILLIAYVTSSSKRKRILADLEKERYNVRRLEAQLEVTQRETSNVRRVSEEKEKLANRTIFEKQAEIASAKTELTRAKAMLAGSESLIKSFFDSISLKELSGMPIDTEIGEDGFPRIIGCKRDWGDPYTRYVSSHESEVYHQRGCRHANIPINVCDQSFPKRPALCCTPDLPPDMKWFANYIQYKAYCESKGITPCPDNVVRMSQRRSG